MILPRRKLLIFVVRKTNFFNRSICNANLHIITYGKLIFKNDEETGNDILHKTLGTKSDC